MEIIAGRSRRIILKQHPLFFGGGWKPEANLAHGLYPFSGPCGRNGEADLLQEAVEFFIDDAGDERHQNAAVDPTPEPVAHRTDSQVGL